MSRAIRRDPRAHRDTHRTQRDPRSRAEAKRRVRTLLDRAEDVGVLGDLDLDAAAVLIDALAYSTKPWLGEDLALVMNGRSPRDSALHGRRGTELRHSPTVRSAALRSELATIRMALFAPRRSPCLPSQGDLARLFDERHGDHEGADVRGLWRQLLSAVRTACGRGRSSGPGQDRVERTLSMANDLLRGNGVEAIYVGPLTRALYVNMDDTYDTTLAYNFDHNRFVVTTYGDLVEAIERRDARRRG